MALGPGLALLALGLLVVGGGAASDGEAPAEDDEDDEPGGLGLGGILREVEAGFGIPSGNSGRVELSAAARKLPDFFTYTTAKGADVVRLPKGLQAKSQRIARDSSWNEVATGDRVTEESRYSSERWVDPRVIAADEGWTKDDLQGAVNWFAYMVREAPRAWTGAGADPDWTSPHSTEGTAPLAIGALVRAPSDVLGVLPFMPATWRRAWLNQVRSGPPPRTPVQGTRRISTPLGTMRVRIDEPDHQVGPWTADQWWRLSLTMATTFSRYFGLESVADRLDKTYEGRRMARLGAGYDKDPRTTPDEEATHWATVLAINPTVSAYGTSGNTSSGPPEEA